jgi:hypothetical protein
LAPIGGNQSKMAQVTVKLAVGNFSVEVSGEEAYADKKFEELVARFLSWKSGSTMADSVVVQVASEAPGGKKTSAGEFVKKSAAKNQVDRALVLGYFLEKHERVASFTSSELTDLGREIKQPFANASDIVAKLTGRGLMMSAGDKDGHRAYALTASGETYVETLMESKQ